ncbi:NAD-dependent epimerase/dehydratase family protein [Paenibacillus rhizophilus]|uniref:NAD(P)-dependent oxidoreductase n=1 Tax=Paenibacillus rhizophilus TaxID=1850366 RepID=A0A3N9P1Q1_9BACL|nr:NAD-dependent epimerase/dehydratase family protein [Paenibacillus rhizophilus]RQW10131.1 NAD(P)-dependent oxidoreductase [Paenibacillus rhizophilus]
MTSCLIGYTGYVGSTLLRSTAFDDLYNSKNVDDIKGKDYDLVVCAAAPAVKWKANKNPEEDLQNIEKIIGNLKTITAKKFVLISTVDVYKNPIEVDEETEIIPEEVTPYGRHRFYLEEFIQKKFPNHLVIRLPGLFGEGLKKNFIYDLIHTNCLHLTHRDSQFQFYNMDSLWNDIKTALNQSLSLVNFVIEPVSAHEVAEAALNITFDNVTENPPVYYDMRSKYSYLFNNHESEGYFKNKNEILSEITAFISKERAKL